MANIRIYEGTLLDESITYTYIEFRDMGSFEEKAIVELIEYGVIQPKGTTQQEWVFTSLDLVRSQKAMRLHKDLNINWPGISLALELLDEIHELREAVKLLEKDQGK